MTEIAKAVPLPLFGARAEQPTSMTATEPIQGSAAALGCTNLWRGDARMNRAVQCKLLDPHLSLEMALRKGGFCYPSQANGMTLDGEKVSLRQRKNQLSRRVRQAKREGGLPSKNEPHTRANVCSPGSSYQMAPLAPISGTKRPVDHMTEDSVLSVKAPRVAVTPPPQQHPEIGSGYVVLAVLMPCQGLPQGVQGCNSVASSVTNSIVADDMHSWESGGIGEEQSPVDQEQSQEMSLDPLLLLDEVQKEACEDFKYVPEVLSEQQDDPRLQRALDIFEKEMSFSGYQRAMGFAGFNPRERSVSSPKFHQFASLALAEESERLVGIFKRSHHEKADLPRTVHLPSM